MFSLQNVDAKFGIMIFWNSEVHQRQSWSTLAQGNNWLNPHKTPLTVVDPGIPVGGHGPHRGGPGPLRQLCYENFVISPPKSAND